jgi:hypothetical protein
MQRIPSRVLEFIEFYKVTNTTSRLSQVDDLLHHFTLRIKMSEIVIEEKPRVYYTLEIKGDSPDQVYQTKKNYKAFKTLHAYL